MRAAGLGDDVLDHAGDQAAHRLVHAAGGLDAGIARIDLAHDVADDRNRGDVVERKQVGAQAVVDVVGVIGDVVGERGDLRFRAGKGPQLQILDLRVGAGSPPARRVRR